MKTPAQLLLSNPISPPPLNEIPHVHLHPNITVMISDECYPGWNPVYRGDVWNMQADVHILEEAIPLWLLEFLLFNRAAAPPNIKVSFVLLPWPSPDPSEQLPELLNTLVFDLVRFQICVDHVFQCTVKINSNQVTQSEEVNSACTWKHTGALVDFVLRLSISGSGEARKDINAVSLNYGKHFL